MDLAGGLGDLVSTSAAPVAQLVATVAGLVAIVLGLRMARQAFSDARASKPTQEDGVIKVNGVEVSSALGQAGAQNASLAVPAEFFKVLPELVKTAAGIVTVVLLVGTPLLLGATFAPADGDADGSPPPSAASGTS